MHVACVRQVSSLSFTLKPHLGKKNLHLTNQLISHVSAGEHKLLANTKQISLLCGVSVDVLNPVGQLSRGRSSHGITGDERYNLKGELHYFPPLGSQGTEAPLLPLKWRLISGIKGARVKRNVQRAPAPMFQ